MGVKNTAIITYIPPNSFSLTVDDPLGLLEDPGAWGLDAAFPAAFVALIVPHVRTRPGQVSAVLGAAIAVVAVPFTPAGAPMLIAALAVGPGLWIRNHQAAGVDDT